jgi:hypothetical protein
MAKDSQTDLNAQDLEDIEKIEKNELNLHHSSYFYEVNPE